MGRWVTKSALHLYIKKDCSYKDNELYDWKGVEIIGWKGVENICGKGVENWRGA